MSNFFTHGKRTISLSGLRQVRLINAASGGGPPYSDDGDIEYDDGKVIKVGFEFASALRDHLTGPKTNESN